MAIVVALVSAATLGWIAAAYAVHSRALADLDRVRSGQPPLRFSSSFGLTDGGSTGWECPGYRVMQIRRFKAPYFDAEGNDLYETGISLQYTCRGWFPILQAYLLEDVEELNP